MEGPGSVRLDEAIIRQTFQTALNILHLAFRHNQSVTLPFSHLTLFQLFLLHSTLFDVILLNEPFHIQSII